MKTPTLNQRLGLAAALFLTAGAALAGPNTTLATGSEFTFSISAPTVTISGGNTTFTYRVESLTGHRISHWVLGINCSSKTTLDAMRAVIVGSNDAAGGYGADNSTPAAFVGYKFDTNYDQNNPRSVSLTLKGTQWTTGPVTALVKASTYYSLTTVLGPVCTTGLAVTCPPNQTLAATCTAPDGVWLTLPSVSATGAVGTPSATAAFLDPEVTNSYNAATNQYFFPVGVTTVLIEVTDSGSSLTASCSYTVTVNAAANCPTSPRPRKSLRNLRANNLTACGEITFSGADLFSSITAFSTIVYSGLPGYAPSYTTTPATSVTALFPYGTSTFSYVAYSASNPTVVASSGAILVTVEDLAAPVFVLAANGVLPAITRGNTPGLCGWTAAYENPVVTDCNAHVTFTFSPAAGTLLPIGTTTVTVTASDQRGNVSSAQFNVVVTDTERPKITAPAAVSASTDAGTCSASGLALGTPTATDNCSGISVTNDAPSSFPKGTTIVTWTVTDAAGNSATATQTVTVTDSEKPTITAPAAITIPTDAGLCSATLASLGNPLTGDNCGVASVTHDAPATFPKGNTTVTWLVTDTSGNTATATQVITVEDRESPTITPPAAVTVGTDAGLCTAAVTLPLPSTGDNCGVASLTNDAPAVFPKGTTLVTWKVTDTSGNVATVTQTVTVNDTEKPKVTAPGSLLVTTDPGKCFATVTLTAPAATDNCGVASITSNAPSTFPTGTTTVTWTVTDTSGNSTTVGQTVTVQDRELPTIVAPATVTVATDAGACLATLVALGTPGTSDNCGVAFVGNNAPSSYPKGTTTVTWTVVDVHGNLATATQLVVVEDREKPTVVAPAAVTACLDSWAGALVSLGSAVTSDNCAVASVTNDAPARFPAGTTTVTWTVVDSSGNTATATQTVTVLAGTIRITKFYDTNFDGVRAATGEPTISGFKIQLAGNGLATPRIVATNAGGTAEFTGLPMGTYTITEIAPGSGWMATTAASLTITVSCDSRTGAGSFGNLLLGAGGGLTIGFWGNNNGEKTLANTTTRNTSTAAMTANLAALSALNLRNATGADFNPTTFSGYNSWLQSANASNMAYMLSAQLSAAYNNVYVRPNNFSSTGGVNPLATIYAPGVVPNAPFQRIVDVINAANAELGLHGVVLSGSPYRAYQEAMKTALDRANNNLNFVQAPVLSVTY